jgi:hypothetical protein
VSLSYKKVVSYTSSGEFLNVGCSGAGLLAKEWEAFTPTVNDLIKVRL